jgi:hypothetical protein
MPDPVDQPIQDWIKGVVPDGTAIGLGQPPARAAGPAISAYLLEVLKSPAPSTTRRAPLQLALRYLLTASAEAPEQMHELLISLMLAAMEKQEWTVEVDAVPVSLWQSLGLPPQPSFVLRVPYRVERPETLAKPVLQKLEVRGAPVASLYGQVLGRPGDIPITGATVEIPALRKIVQTERNGFFHFSTIPSSTPLDLVVRIKGREFAVRCTEDHASAADPFLIPLELLEE